MNNAETDTAGKLLQNYGLIMLSCWAWPVAVSIISYADKRMKAAEAWEKSHLILQKRTCEGLLIAGFALLVFSIVWFMSLPERHPELLDLLFYMLPIELLFFCMTGWAVVRCLRGLRLAGDRQELKRPASLTIWPV